MGDSLLRWVLDKMIYVVQEERRRGRREKIARVSPALNFRSGGRCGERHVRRGTRRRWGRARWPCGWSPLQERTKSYGKIIPNYSHISGEDANEALRWRQRDSQVHSIRCSDALLLQLPAHAAPASALVARMRVVRDTERAPNQLRRIIDPRTAQ